MSPGRLERGGGIGRLIGYLLDAWAQERLSGRLWCVDTRGPGGLAAAPFYFGWALARVILAAVGERPLVHVHLAGRGSTVRKVLIVHLASALGLKVILHLHDYDYGGFLRSLPTWARNSIRSMFQRSARTIVLGHADAALVRSALAVPDAKIIVMPNAVPRPQVPRRSLQDRGGPVRILFLGDLSRRKGVHDLLSALGSEALRARDVPKWTAILAGGGRELEGFRRDLEALSLGDQVELPGWLPRPEVHHLLAQADILVLPSYAEGLPMSVLEGMAYGLCTVCTPVGALNEVVEHRVSGLLVCPGDVQGLAHTLAECLGDEALRRRLGEAAQRRFNDHHEISGYVRRLQAVYADL